MHCKVICFSQKGYELACEVVKALKFHEVEIVYKGRSEIRGITRTERKLCDIAGDAFCHQQGLIFISAAGIAVRSIAGYVEDKLKDPPVIVIDESGEHVIPVLSGHVGGANALSADIAEAIGSEAVITTASERKKRKGRNDLSCRCCIGIGCKRGKSSDEIEAVVSECFKNVKHGWNDIDIVATIDKKRNEKGLVEFAEKHYLTLMTFSKDALARVDGDFASSDFVRETVGVDNVCERAALAALGGDGKLLIKKFSKNGVTVAMGEKE